MTPQQKEKIDLLPGNWITGLQMSKDYPKLNWEVNEFKIYFLILDASLDKVDCAGYPQRPKKYLYVIPDGSMFVWDNIYFTELYNIVDAKIAMKNLGIFE